MYADVRGTLFRRRGDVDGYSVTPTGTAVVTFVPKQMNELLGNVTLKVGTRCDQSADKGWFD